MLARLVFLAALAAAPMAAAQEAAPPASAEAVAAASARADKIIADAGAQGIFVNKTDGAVPQVEHIASGMRCLLGDNPSDRIYIFPTSTAGIPRGDDVACITREDATDIDVTVYATRYPNGMTTEGIVANAVSGIRQRWPDAIPYEGQVASATVEGLTPPATAAFKIQLDGQEKLTVAVGAQEGAWSFKVRITGPYEQAMAVSLYGSMSMAYVQMGLKDD